MVHSIPFLYAACLAALLAPFSTATAQLMFAEQSQDTVMIVNYGYAEATIFVLSSTSNPPSISPSSLFSASIVKSELSDNGLTNHTIQLTISDKVGSDTITISSGSDVITGSVVGAGVLIFSGDSVISGDENQGATIGQTGTFSYDYQAIDIEGNQLTVSSALISTSSDYMEINTTTTSFSSSKFNIVTNDYRVGTGSFEMYISVPAIEFDGETFETKLNIAQSRTPSPPCVAIGGEYSIESGVVAIPMFNILSPPQSSDINDIKISIGSTSTSWDKDASDLSIPDQTVKFGVSSGGEATITCDGDDAVVIDGPIVISESSTSDLASTLVGDLASVDGYSSLTVNVIDVDSSPDILTIPTAMKIIAKICSLMSALDDKCVLTDLVSGSASMYISGNVKPDDAEDAQNAISNCFDSCECQTELDYECDKLKLGEYELKAVAGTAVGATAGMATWTIVLIAGVGAFTLIAIIMVGLLAVYRRSAEQSESDYSSSGPLGVPDPADLLYEQSIVRDIYGRGDYPNGGPSADVAQERMREAELREEFPRPPSSSNLSRDDASSTYTL